MARLFRALVILLCCPLVSIARAQTTLIPSDLTNSNYWSISPFAAGFALPGPYAVSTYGSTIYTPDGTAYFPDLPVSGDVAIPVFLVDWSDFNPATDESNHNNTNSTLPGYVPRSAQEISDYLNGPYGPADYFRIVSGGQLRIRFDVYPWLQSNGSSYLKDKEPNYYYLDSNTNRWVADHHGLAKDVLLSTVVDHNIDFRQYDADNNNVLDGFVIVYEGQAGALSGTNMSTMSTICTTCTVTTPLMLNIAELVPQTDPNYALFQSQTILFGRFNNIPEQQGTIGNLTSVSTWAHEIGHLLLGFRDYYLPPSDLGYYALSAHAGFPVPYHPAAMEKWLFAHWLEPDVLQQSGIYTLTNHHILNGNNYVPSNVYLYQIPIDNDPNHFLLLENRYYLPESQGGSYFNDKQNSLPPEDGLVIFEVNRYTNGNDQIRRLLPQRVAGEPTTQRIGSFQPGDELLYEFANGHISIFNISPPGEHVSFNAEIFLQGGVVEVPPVTSFVVRDEPLDGSPDALFDSIIVKKCTFRQDVGFIEYSLADVPKVQPLIRAVVDVTLGPNNSVDPALREFEVYIYDANGSGELSDFLQAGQFAGVVSFTVPAREHVQIEVLGPLQDLLANGATHLGVKLVPIGTVPPSYFSANNLLITKAAIRPADSDNDGMPDQWEIDNGLDPNDPADASFDNDGDGLQNIEEFHANTNPKSSDTDSDNLADGQEVAIGLPAGWSMISLPIDATDKRLNAVFPNAVVVYRYEKGTGYVRVLNNEELEVGKGYWILLDQATSYTIPGQPIASYTLPPVHEDEWTMIGGCTDPAKVFPSGCDIGVIYRYVQGIGYQRVRESEHLEFGEGYWILLTNVVGGATIMVETVE